MKPDDLFAAFDSMTLEDQANYRLDLMQFGTAYMKQVGDRYVRVPPAEVHAVDGQRDQSCPKF